MGLFDFFKKKEPETTPEKPAGPASITIKVKPDTIYQPLSGNVIPIQDIPDPVFSSGALGNGCGIEPTQEIVYSPVDGTISTVPDTKHAVGLTSDSEVEILIHVGIDTVNMNGEGFNVLVQEGQKIKAGDPLMTFSREAIKAAGYKDTTACLVINADMLKDFTLLHTGSSEAGDALISYKQ